MQTDEKKTKKSLMKVLSECQICQLSTSDKLHSTVPSTPVRLTPVCQNYKDTANL